MRASVEGIGSKIYNLGTGQKIRIKNLVEKIICMVGRQVNLESDPARLRPEKSEVMNLISDNTLA